MCIDTVRIAQHIELVMAAAQSGNAVRLSLLPHPSLLAPPAAKQLSFFAEAQRNHHHVPPEIHLPYAACFERTAVHK
jgi:hypothetical protein